MQLLLNSREQNDGSLLKPQHRSSFRASGLLSVGRICGKIGFIDSLVSHDQSGRAGYAELACQIEVLLDIDIYRIPDLTR